MKLIAKNAMNLLLVSMALIATHSTAQTVTTYDELFKRVGATQTIATLGVDALGDKFNLYDGSLEFVQTDVSLPGNNALPVSLSRRFTTNEDKILRGHFGDWDIELPRIQGSFANQRASGNYGWTVAAEAADMYKRCSRFGEPPEAHAQADGGMFDAGEFWNGNSIYMPGQGSEQLLWRSTTNTKAPSTTTEWPIVTKGGWQISCLSNIAN
ncbi:hypothetical protein, partial [Ideonella sp.]|uniref:hypothetical protein n=1 Tax=Ideonella sp. TaxID=1929293 RepID=UPI003BB5BBED